MRGALREVGANRKTAATVKCTYEEQERGSREGIKTNYVQIRGLNYTSPQRLIVKRARLYRSVAIIYSRDRLDKA